MREGSFYSFIIAHSIAMRNGLFSSPQTALQHPHHGIRVPVLIGAQLIQQAGQAGVGGPLRRPGVVQPAAGLLVIPLPQGRAPAGQIDAVTADDGPVALPSDQEIDRQQPPGMAAFVGGNVPQLLPGPGRRLPGQGL